MLSTLAISWPAKEVVSHTFRAWKAARNFDLDGQGPLQRDERVWCCGFFFLSHGTPKIPSSLNKPVPGSKIAGKAKRGESARVRIMVDLWQFSSASATWTCIFTSSSSPCQQNRSWACPFAARGFLLAFFFSSCHPVSSCWKHCDKIYDTQHTTCLCVSNSISNVKTFTSQLQNLIPPPPRRLIKLRLVQNSK